MPLTLATLVAETPRTGDWLHEIKYDGYRIAARIDRGGVHLLSRNGLDWTSRFSGVAEALGALPTSGTWLDGEAVVFDERGVSDFGALQGVLKKGRPEDVAYVVFDLLFEDGEDLRELPLTERKLPAGAAARARRPRPARAWCATATTSRGAETPSSKRPACRASRAWCPSAPTARTRAGARAPG